MIRGCVLDQRDNTRKGIYVAYYTVKMLCLQTTSRWDDDLSDYSQSWLSGRRFWKCCGGSGGADHAGASCNYVFLENPDQSGQAR